MKLVRALALAAPVALLPTIALAETRTYDLADFDRISVAAGIRADVTVGPEQSVTVETDDPEIFDKLKIEVRGGRLDASFDFNLIDTIFGGGILSAIFGDDARVTMTVTVPSLIEAESSAGATVRVDDMQGDRLRLEASSGASLFVASLAGDAVDAESSSGASLAVEGGACGSLSADSSSGASLRADGLECDNVRAEASSGASLSVSASGTLEVDSSSGASVHVSGDPDQVSVNSSSGGSINFN